MYKLLFAVLAVLAAFAAAKPSGLSYASPVAYYGSPLAYSGSPLAYSAPVAYGAYGYGSPVGGAYAPYAASPVAYSPYAASPVAYAASPYSYYLKR